MPRRPTTLRFSPPPSPPPPVAAAELTRHLLASLSSRPSPLPYLPAHPPAYNAYLSLLTLLPDNKTPDPTLLPFLTAVSSIPAAIPHHTRALISTSSKLQSAALLSAITAFHTAISTLLSLEDPHDLTTSEITDSVSAPSASDSATAVSLSTVRSNLAGRVAARVAEPLRCRLAARAVRRLARSTWLASIPLPRRPQEAYVTQRMGFVPLYLSHIKNPLARVIFVYIIDAVLLGKGVGVSAGMRSLIGYVLARLAENSVLTAHFAFLADRFAVSGSQLAAAMDLPFLVALQKVLRKKRRDHVPVSGSTTTTTATTVSSVSTPPTSPPPVFAEARKRLRARRDAFGEYLDGEDGGGMIIPRDRSLPGSFAHRKRALSSTVERQASFLFGDPVHDGASEGWDMAQGGHYGAGREGEWQRQSSLQEGLDEVDDSDSDDGSSTSTEAARGDLCDPAMEEQDKSFYDLGDNPEVPDVDGLNAINGEEDYDIADEPQDPEVVDDLYAPYEQYSPILEADHAQCEVAPAEDDVEYYEDEVNQDEADECIFTEEEVAVLLLAHDVAQASRRNSKRDAKNPDAIPKPLVRPAQAALIHELFEAEAIMDIIAVVAAFQLLQRWTVCYPYRPGSLEEPIFKFMQSPIAKELCVGSVGQRGSTKSSAKLRISRGRSIRLPRHALVDEL